MSSFSVGDEVTGKAQSKGSAQVWPPRSLGADRPMLERCAHNNDPATCEACFAALRKAYTELREMAAAMASVLGDEVQAEWGAAAGDDSIQDRLLDVGLLRARSVEEIDACYANEEVCCMCRDNAPREDVDICYTFSDAMKELLK